VVPLNLYIQIVLYYLCVEFVDCGYFCILKRNYANVYWWEKRMRCIKFSIIFLSYYSCYVQAAPLHEERLYKREEKFSEGVFLYKESVINGLKKEQWLIDNKPVDQDYFDKQRLAAQQQELAEQQERERAAQVALEAKKNQLQMKAYKKIFGASYATVEALLEKLQKYKLAPFAQFCPKTFASAQDLEQFSKIIMPELGKLLTKESGVIELHEFATITNRLQMYEERLQQFFIDTVENAINRCDDTKLLKKLIEVIESYNAIT